MFSVITSIMILGTIGFAQNAFAIDSDGDTIDDSVDNCPIIANPLQEDADEDSIGDVCEAICPDIDDIENMVQSIYPNPTSGQINIYFLSF